MNAEPQRTRSIPKGRVFSTVLAVFILAMFLMPSAALSVNAQSPVQNPSAMNAMVSLPVPHYFGPYPNYATSQLPTVTYDPTTGAILSASGGIRKFVDSLPGLGPSGKNDLGQYIPVAVPDKNTYNGSDYYVIAVIQYQEKMHSDLSPTTLRGYVQLETPVNFAVSKHVVLMYPNGTAIKKPDGTPAIAVDNPHYLGPTIVAQRDRPVRVLFYNLLPTGVDGNLFIPCDTTVMGSGMGPMPMFNPDGSIMLNPDGTVMYENYTQNRATLHLHGGVTPWISDGTPNQWTTPANEMTSYPKGVSVQNVPDMPAPGPGALTFYYTNHQSARLMFYHDHAYGITRLNVYIGEAAPYLLTDNVEQQLIADGIIPSTEIPLVVQDKTFVPDNTKPITNMYGVWASQLAFQDPTWNTTLWGAPGSLWYPHVYMPFENPGDPSGYNQFGRWMYSPWFYPPVAPTHGPIKNPYYTGPGNPMEPLMIPGVPSISMPGEAFLDTPVVNGAAYPYLNVTPSSYRFRILNAADDRIFNLQLYVADPTVVTADGRTNTEVKMVPAYKTAGFPAYWPTDGRDGDVPDPATAGPNMIQIGTEGGFLPAPVVLVNKPVNWNWDWGTFDFGNVNQGTLILGPAERADVIVDFSQFAGKTLILYNDAPAPFPAGEARDDHFTGDPDFTSTGGCPTTIPGYGPNTRTIMQIRVANTAPAAPFNLTALNAAFNTTSTHVGVFEADQDPIVVPQSAYNSAYNGSWAPNTWVHIQDTNITFTPINATAPITINFQPKALHDEMGAAYDPEYGRMAVMLGVEQPNPTGQTANAVLYDYFDPPTELVDNSIQQTKLGTLPDGTQIWKISHNGVDTHALHWHLFEVQKINAVAWDGGIRPPDPNEIGWKDTIRINPLQDLIVALRPMKVIVPFDMPNSVRPLDVTQPIGTLLKSQNGLGADPLNNPVDIVNHEVNFGDEYVWHCHMLAHEEMDMMRTIVVGRAPLAPSGLLGAVTPSGVSLTWTDNSLSETSFTVQRAEDWSFTTGLTNFTVPADVTTYSDTTALPSHLYYYRVYASDLVGDTFDYATAFPGAVGFPTLNTSSGFSNIYAPYYAPNGTVTLLSLTQAPAPAAPIVATWQYVPSGDQTGFIVERATDVGFTTGLWSTSVGASVRSFSDYGTTPGGTYYYRVQATNLYGGGNWSNVLSIVTGTVPAGATTLLSLTQNTVVNAPIVATWSYAPSGDQTSFELQRATDNGFIIGFWNTSVAAGLRTYTDTSTLTPGGTYFYRVRAINPFGPGTWSNVMSIVTGNTPTGTATLLSLVQSQVLNAPILANWSYVPGVDQTSFDLQRATDSGFTLGVWTTIVGPSVRSYSDTSTLTPGATYFYHVRAVDAFGSGTWSNSMSIKTCNIPTGATTLTSLTQALSVGAPLVSIWTYSPSGDQTGFDVQRATNSAFTQGLWSTSVGSSVTSYSDTSSLTPGGTYYYRIRATNAVGAGAWSNAKSITTGKLPSGTTTLTGLSQGLTLNAPIVISWTYSPGGDQTGFTVMRATNSGFTTGVWTTGVAGNLRSYADSSSLTPGGTYFYRVQATDAYGGGTWSNPMSIKTGNVPTGTTTLTSLTKAATAGSPVALTWTYSPSGDQTGFVIQRATDSGFTANVWSATAGAYASSYSDTSTLTTGMTYYYRIRATDAYGGGTWSNSMSIKTGNVPTGKTTLMSVTQAAARLSPVVLTWTYSPTGDQTGFVIQRSTNAQFTGGVLTFRVGSTATSYTDGTVRVLAGTYYYRVAASNAQGTGTFSAAIGITTHR